jgi:SAM-dependent methyltransferase
MEPGMAANRHPQSVDSPRPPVLLNSQSCCLFRAERAPWGIDMSSIERGLYKNIFDYALNQIALPIKLVIPQPVIARFPFLTTNLDVRMGVVAGLLRGRVLDIGCGENRLVEAYRAGGGDGVGVDVYPWEGVDRLVEDTARLDDADATFDTITFVSCLNHIPNRRDVLIEARRLLRSDGQVVLTNLTPRISRVWHKWAFWDEDQHERGMKEGEVWGFTHAELVDMLRHCGFVLKNSHGFSWGLNRVYVFVPSGDSAQAYGGAAASGSGR